MTALPSTSPPTPTATTSSPTPTPSAQLSTAAEYAETAGKAMAKAKTAKIVLEGGRDQSTEEFRATGRLQYQPGKSSRYDIVVWNTAHLRESETPKRITLVGNTGYPMGMGRKFPADAAHYYKGDPYADMAMVTRWVTSPYNILSLFHPWWGPQITA